MRPSAGAAANVLAWAVLIGLVCIAFVMVIVLGPFGLILLGLLTLFICTSFQLREDTPIWITEVSNSRTGNLSSPEQRAAIAEERAGAFAPLKFYRWCGVVLLVAGVVGFVWQRMA